MCVSYIFSLVYTKDNQDETTQTKMTKQTTQKWDKQKLKQIPKSKNAYFIKIYLKKKKKQQQQTNRNKIPYKSSN